MSANEKELRASQKTERQERRAAAAAEQDKKDRRYRRNAIIIAVVLVVLIVFALVINSNLLYTKTTALKIGDTKYSPAEVSFYYHTTYNSFYQTLHSQLGDYISMILDTSKPLDEQEYPYGENQTWADAVAEQSQQDLVRITALCDAAAKAGRTLNETEQAYVDSQVSTMQQYAASNGYDSVDKFLNLYYGKGVDLKLFTKQQERIALASGYSEELQNSFSYTDDELSAYYADHADEYNTYQYYVYPVNNSDAAFEGLEGEELSSQVHAAAQKIADATTDFDSMTAAIREYTGENTVITIAGNPVSNIGESYKDWITDPARQKNDVTVADSENASYVVLFVELNRNDYKVADFRHILVNAVPDENGNYTEDALAAAKEKAELLLEQWRTDPTEDNFAEIAKLNSEDQGSYSNGGLYTDVKKYDMVPGVNDFLFNEGHSVGDYGIVFGQSSSYTGYHVMYFSGESDQLYCDTLADTDLRAADYEALYNELSAGYTITKGSGLRMVKL